LCFHSLCFNSSDFAEAAEMPLRLAVLGSQVCLYKVPCHFWAHGPATHAEYVHVIIFDTLM